MPGQPQRCPQCPIPNGVIRRKVGKHFYYFCKIHQSTNLGPVASSPKRRTDSGRYLHVRPIKSRPKPGRKKRRQRKRSSGREILMITTSSGVSTSSRRGIGP